METEIPQRRLAAIVALDVVGYSAMAESDEERAAQLVRALAERTAAVSEALGGRVFSTAGDGFMIEFPTASGALRAAEQLSAAGDPPVRVGVHLGEVLVTPSGDLLGHGVNVTARLQAQAPPGGVLVSADIQRALRGTLAERLMEQGAVRLDKMDETIRVFRLAATAPERRPRAFPKRSALLVLALGLLVAAVVAGGWWWWRSHGAGEPRVAVAGFAAPAGDPGSQTFAAGLANEITDQLSNNQVLPIAAAGAGDAASRLGAAFLVGGSVEHDGGALRVRVRLDDAASRVTLWSETFEGPAARPAPLQVAVAAKAVNYVSRAVEARRGSHGRLDPKATADYVRGGALAFGGAVDLKVALDARAALQRVVARAPDFAAGHSALAMACAIAVRRAPSDQAAAFRREADVEARRALALDPRDGQAYLVLSVLTPQRRWRDRQRVLEQGLAVSPDLSYLVNDYSYFLAEAGRTQEAVVASQRGLTLNALHPGANYEFAEHLMQAGRNEEAAAAIAHSVQYWPEPWLRQAQLSIAMLTGAPEEARRLLAENRARGPANETAALEAWAAYLRARTAPGPAARAEAVRLLRQTAGKGVLRKRDAILALASLGATDAALSMADPANGPFDEFAPATSDGWSTEMLFAPQAAPLREDPRFWRIMARLGLADYWLASGRWPDFCGAFGAQRCRSMAAAAAGSPA